MEQQFCANTNCIKSSEHRGGRFLFNMADKKTYCEDCYRVAVVMEPGRNLWDFTTTHFDGKKTHVRSLAHLRKLEVQHGVSNQLANNYERSCR